jgi:hypothetical protein
MLNKKSVRLGIALVVVAGLVTLLLANRTKDEILVLPGYDAQRARDFPNGIDYEVIVD